MIDAYVGAPLLGRRVELLFRNGTEERGVVTGLHRRTGQITLGETGVRRADGTWTAKKGARWHRYQEHIVRLTVVDLDPPTEVPGLERRRSGRRPDRLSPGR